MANKYPYVASAGPLLKTIEHLRKKSFPKEITADTLRKLGVAPKNESYVINVLRFLGVLDDEGKKVDAKAAAFVQHKDEEFQSQFGQLVRDAYEELFEHHGDDAWKVDRAGLTQFFRSSDKSSDLVGRRQAGTFTALASLAGKVDATNARETSPRKSPSRPARPTTSTKPAGEASSARRPPATRQEGGGESRVGLSVRIEVNLPAGGDQDTYDRIFKSIRKNLLDG